MHLSTSPSLIFVSMNKNYTLYIHADMHIDTLDYVIPLIIICLFSYSQYSNNMNNEQWNMWTINRKRKLHMVVYQSFNT